MDLQAYVTQMIEAAGGLVLPMEYALSHVLLPKELSFLFNQREEVLLAFDYDVFLENPSSEFITFGSNILDGLIALNKENTFVGYRYGIVDRISPSEPEAKLKNFIRGELHMDGELTLLEESQRMGLWMEMIIRQVFSGEEMVEEFCRVCVDANTGQLTQELLECFTFYESKPIYELPLAPVVDFDLVLAAAFSQADVMAQETAVGLYDERALKADIKRLNEYYSELLKQNTANMRRKNITVAHKETLKQKALVIQGELQRQIDEVIEKSKPRAVLSLEHLIFYEAPRVLYSVELKARNKIFHLTIDYNPLLKKFQLMDSV